MDGWVDEWMDGWIIGVGYEIGSRDFDRESFWKTTV
jgi:hypothetical protein